MMKKVALLALTVSILFISPTAQAQTRYELGFGNLALKMDYLRFMDSGFKDYGMENAFYVGVEGYVSVFMPNLYLGMEVGWAGASNDKDFQGIVPVGEGYAFVPVSVDLSVDYVPIEFNAKYVFSLAPSLSLDVGGGLSINYLSLNADVDRWYYGGSGSVDDWVFGGQVFASINYKITPAWFLGANFKYQWTEDLSFDPLGYHYNTGISADNLRVGGQVGYMF